MKKDQSILSVLQDEPITISQVLNYRSNIIRKKDGKKKDIIFDKVQLIYR